MASLRTLARDPSLAHEFSQLQTDPGFECAEQRAELQTGLLALDERAQQIVLLRFVKGLSQREIADRVGLSQMHVSRLLRKAIEDMREVLTADHAATAA